MAEVLRADPSKWPPGVRPVSVDELDHLGIDAERRLYWNGERIRTGIALSFWQTVAVVIATLSLLATGLRDRLEFIYFLMD